VLPDGHRVRGERGVAGPRAGVRHRSGAGRRIDHRRLHRAPLLRPGPRLAEGLPAHPGSQLSTAGSHRREAQGSLPVNALTGQQFEIRHGGAYAVITEVGAHLRLLQVDGRDVVVPFAADELPPASNGAVLAPWPNRLRDGQYSFDGVDYQVPLTEPARQTALHGLVSWLRWGVRSHTASAVELAVDLPPTPGYPFPLTVATRYELSQAGLEV